MQDNNRAFLKGMSLGILLCIIIFGFLSGTGIGNIDFVAEKLGHSRVFNNKTTNKLNVLESYIEKTYYDDVDSEALVDGAFKGMFEALDDPYSAYYTAEEWKKVRVSSYGNYAGIGVVMTKDAETGEIYVLSVYEDSPADRAGILEGDIIVSVDGNLGVESDLSVFVSKIKEKPGTSVNLVIRRPGEENELTFDIVREYINLPTVGGAVLEDGIGIIQIVDFGTGTAPDFKDTFEELKNDGMTKLIIDVRNNKGGLVDSATDILDFLLPEGVTVWREFKDGSKQEYKSDADCQDIPIAVLVNKNTASSSEILAGAIQDFGYGVIIGTVTYGKGVTQALKELSDGSALRLTDAKYFTPSGKCIHGEGITPDIEVENDDSDESAEFDYTKDSQLMRAINELKDSSK